MCDILLIEDNQNFRRMLVETIAARYPEAEIIAVKSGEEAMQAVQRSDRITPRVILLDIFLPGINGLQVAEKIRKANTAAAIVVITGNDFPEYREAARAKGADFFMSKNTVRLEEILSLTGSLLEEDVPRNDIAKRYRLSASG